MDPVHDKGVHGPGPYFDGPGPWTRSTEGVHGPGVHVLYFPESRTFSISSKVKILMISLMSSLSLKLYF